MKKITILSSALAMTAAVSAMAVPVSAATKKDRIAAPKDSATFLSLTYTELFDTLNSDEYHVSMTNTETGEVKTVARRDEDTYISSTDKNGKVTTNFVVDGTLYTVDDEEETITTDILNVPVQDVSVIDYASLKFEMSDDTEDGGTVEQFKAGTSTEYYYFNSSDELVKVIIVDKKGNETEYKITDFSDEIPDDLFSTKNGYEIISAKYKLKDTRVMTVFDELLSGDDYTLAFDNNEYSVTLVKDGYDFYSSIVDQVEKTTNKQLALGAVVYKFNDSNRTYTESDRKYDDQIPVFFDTSKYELEGIEKVTENKKTYIVETMSDNTGIYKFYWSDKNLVKIETVNASDKILDTTTFKTFSTDADTAALVLPSSYKLEEAEKPDISVGEGEEEDATLLEPEQTTAVVTEPVETTAETTAETTTTVTTTTTTNSPKTGQSAYALAAIPVALIASVMAVLHIKKRK